ncbi:hypothetical protein [Marinobacterium maritimum]
MDKQIKWLKISLKVEMLIGVVAGGILALVLGTMATDSPTSGTLEFIMGALFGFALVATPMLVIPALSIRELNRFPENRKFVFNYLNTVIVLVFVFFPLAIWQIYTLAHLKANADSMHQVES